MNLAATKRHWPLGRGFERFYGFLGAETNQWYPELVYDNHPVDPPGTPEDGYHLIEDIADKAIEFIRDAKVIAPDKPWFLYYARAPATRRTTSPKEWADKYRGPLRHGLRGDRETDPRTGRRRWASSRRTPSCRRSTRSALPRPAQGPGASRSRYQDTIRPWDPLDDEEKRLFSRMAEVYAGFLSYADAPDRPAARLPGGVRAAGQHHHRRRLRQRRQRRGRPERVGEREQVLQRHTSTPQENMAVLRRARRARDLQPLPERVGDGVQHAVTRCGSGTPAQGGIADTAIISWPNGIGAHGEVRDTYVNVCDVTPTIYDLLGMTPRTRSRASRRSRWTG